MKIDNYKTYYNRFWLYVLTNPLCGGKYKTMIVYHYNIDFFRYDIEILNKDQTGFIRIILEYKKDVYKQLRSKTLLR